MKALQLVKKLEKKLIKQSNSETLKFICFEILNDLEEIKKELRSNSNKELTNERNCNEIREPGKRTSGSIN